MLTAVLYLPLWFQAIKGSTAVKSGIQTIPLVLSLVVASILCGGLVHRVGYYTQFLYLGLHPHVYRWRPLDYPHCNIDHSHWIGYQVIFGLGYRKLHAAVQSRCASRLTQDRRAHRHLGNLLLPNAGGAIFVSVGQNVFLNKFLKALGKLPGPSTPKPSSAPGPQHCETTCPKQPCRQC